MQKVEREQTGIESGSVSSRASMRLERHFSMPNHLRKQSSRDSRSLVDRMATRNETQQSNQIQPGYDYRNNQDNNNNNNTDIQPAKLSNLKRGSDNCCPLRHSASELHFNSSLNRHHRHRHSQSERCCIISHNQLGSELKLPSSTSSPSSSTASDSAFSQSQTTLESETIEQTDNCFQCDPNLVKSDKIFRIHHNHNHHNSHHNHHSNGRDNFVVTDHNPSELVPSNVTTCQHMKQSVKNQLGQFTTDINTQRGELPGDCSIPQQFDDDSNHFEIIWKNLSYTIPDRKFASQLEKINSIKDSFLRKFHVSPKEELAPEIDNETYSPPLGPQIKAPVVGRPRKVIFENLNGSVRSGQLTAILGPSGAGKTTFLKCLTNNIVKGVAGSIDIRGGKAIKHRLKLCIIPQKDYLFDNLTVMENLLFASRIKNTQTNFEHYQNAHRVANLLGLQSCLKLKTSKLSGGQYKRVSIAQELLSKPDILILDEPTSGLDSRTCFRTVSVLRDLVNMSRVGLMPPLAIVMTIHQPQIKIFNLFNHVYIMSSIGQSVYEGPPGFLIDTVADRCKLLPPADDLNPASFIIDIASEVYGTEPIEQLVKFQLENFKSIHTDYLNTFRGGCSQLGNNGNNDGYTGHDFLNTSHKVEILLGKATPSPSDAKFEVKNPNSEELKSSNDEAKSVMRRNESSEVIISDRLKRRNNYRGNFWLHTWLLVKRLWISSWRDPLLTTTRITFHLVIPFVFYFIYSPKSGAANACPHVEREIDLHTFTSTASIQRLEEQHNELILTFENVSLFFILLYSFSMCVLAVTALSFPLNMQILLKETSNGWYSMPRFVMAKTLADLPMELTMPMISVAIAYILTGQPSSHLSWRMLTVTAVMTLCSLISQTQGLLFGAYFMNNIQAAVFISQASSLPWIMLSGFTTRVSELPMILQWLSFGSIYRLGIESIVAVRYGFGICPCDHELVNDTPAKMIGIPEQLRSLMRYYMDAYSEQPQSTGSLHQQASNSTSEDIFAKIASTLSRANTYGVDIVSCHDVRPFILSAREVDEGTLPMFLLILVFIFVSLKLLLFGVVRLRTG